MSNPTTPFSWQMPTATDLVTDLPADFEVFGQAVATSMADLLGGTSGQILAKNSNTDMDFIWVTNDVGDITAVTAGTGISGGGTSGAVTITNSMATEITAKGDLIVGTGSATFDNLAAGANGETLVADSAATTGLRYSATPSASNPVLNSAMQNWQRGTSFSFSASTAASSSTYTTDRWQTKTNANQAVTVSRQATGDTTNLPFIQYAYRYQRNSGQTGTGDLDMIQNFESVNSIPFAGKTVTYSFYARKGADYSAASSALTARIFTGTGTDQNIFSGYTGTVTTNVVTATLTTSWQRFSGSTTIGATATQIATDFLFVPVGTAGTNDYYEVTGVQLDVGSVALPFRTYAATIQGELAACQRYYYRITSSTGFSPVALGQNYSTTAASVSVPFPVQMRVVPTVLDTTGTAANYVLTTAAFGTGSNSILPTQYNATTQSAMITATVASGLVAGNATHLLFDGASRYLGFGAEL